MKAIYVKIGNNVYKVKQNTAIPTSVTFRASGVSSSMNVDPFNKAVIQNIYINNLERPGTKSNRELYEEMVDFIRSQKITEIKEIQNFFKVYVDYSIFAGRREIDHLAVIKPMQVLDKTVLLGVAENNECVYRRVKTFSPKIEFKMTNSLPHGIMQTPKEDYSLKINNIAIFQDFSAHPEIHESTYEVPYRIGSTTIQSSVDNMRMIYSTEEQGIDIQDINLQFTPRKVTVSLDIVLADYVVVYDDQEIEKILMDNKNGNFDPIVPPGGDDNPDNPGGDDKPDQPGGDDKPDQPGSDNPYDPDGDGYFSYYERCNQTTPNALLVVEDSIPDEDYDTISMIKISNVISDIEDIEVGEYVVLIECIDGLI